jgi:patatin-like phospholipase/acyl hydrolase
MSPAVLALDGGGVRGVIPFEFLLLVQEHLRPCTLQDVIDLAIGTSSGQSQSNHVMSAYCTKP